VGRVRAARTDLPATTSALLTDARMWAYRTLHVGIPAVKILADGSVGCCPGAGGRTGGAGRGGGGAGLSGTITDALVLLVAAWL
jgi:hypothetical protein